MFRGRFPFRRPGVRRPLLRAALFGGLGYLAGRRSSETRATSGTDITARLAELDRLRAAGTITGEEYAAKRADLLSQL